MNTKARRFKRLPLQIVAQQLMRLMFTGLAIWFLVLLWQHFGVTNAIASALRQQKGLATTLLTWELRGATLPESPTLLGMTLALEPSIARPAPITPEVIETWPEILTPTPSTAIVRDEEPGLSSAEPAEHHTAPPQTTPQTETLPTAVTLSAGGGQHFLKVGGVYIRNETTIDVDVAKLSKRKVALKLTPHKPQILIVHTHGSETFWPTPTGDTTSVIAIGNRLTDLWRAEGFEVLHDTTSYDRPNFNNAYSSALEGITKTIKENPSIQIVLDIHRDAIQSSDGAVRKCVTTVDGQKVAQMMLVVGTNNTGLPHADWPHNLAFAVALQGKLSAATPELMRPINLRRERFNQHATRGSLILEVGAYGNNPDEALRAIELFARDTTPFLKTLIQ